MSADLCFLSATQLAQEIRARSLSPVDVVEAHLARIDCVDGRLRAYVTVLAERALADARAAERAVLAGEQLGPLHGVPLAIKDEGELAGVPNSLGVRALADAVSTRTSIYVERVIDAGAIVLGKTNMPELGHKAVTDNRYVGPTSTPFDPARNAGGSSGGSAAAVGAGLATLAQGGDGGGSIRIPASLCGVYGLKPTFGRVAADPRPDAFALALPRVSYGPLTRTVADAALLLGVLAGADDRDPLALPDDGCDYGACVRERAQLAGARVAFVPDLGGFPVAADVAALVADAVADLELAGLRVEQVPFDWGMAPHELAALWTRLASVGYAGTIDALRRRGNELALDDPRECSASFARYLDAARGASVVDHCRDRTGATQVFDRARGLFERYDFVVAPVVAVAGVENAPDAGTVGPTSVAGEAIDPLLGWCLTYPFNLTGHPAASVPAGLTNDGLPVGLQVVGRMFRDDQVLALSAALEEVRPWAASYERVRALW